jgi:outer membrane protein, heavy metal efflux system
MLALVFRSRMRASLIVPFVITLNWCCLGQSTPLTIDDAIHEALEKNLSLLAERFNLSVADARIVQARLKPNPVLSLALDYQNVFRENWSPSGGQGPPEWSARMDYLIERGGKRGRRVEVAEGVKAVAQLQLLNTTRQLVFDVQSAFVDVQAAKESVALARANLASLEAIVKVNTARVNAGDLARVDLVRSRVAAVQFKTALAAAELKLKTTKSRLQLLIGRRAASDSFDVAGDIRHDNTFTPLPELHADAVRLRPDLLALRRDQARSQADIRLQLAQGKIDYTVGTQYHRQFDIIHANSFGFFFSAPLPVFNRNQGEIERARQEDRQIEARIRAAEASIDNEVETAYQQFSSSRDLLSEIEKNMLNEARDVRQITEYSYRRGEASLLELLDAQRAFNDAMQTYNDARADFARSLYRLDSASGRGVNP